MWARIQVHRPHFLWAKFSSTPRNVLRVFIFMPTQWTSGIRNDIVMIDTHLLAGNFYFCHISDRASSLERAFDVLFWLPGSSSSHSESLRKWRNLRVAAFKTPTKTRERVIEKLFEAAQNLRDQLDDAHRHSQHLIKVLEPAIRDQPVVQYVDCISHCHKQMEYLYICLEAVAKQALQDPRISSNLTIPSKIQTDAIILMTTIATE